MSDQHYARSKRAKIHRLVLLAGAPLLALWAYTMDPGGARWVIGAGAVGWLLLGIIDSPGRIEKKQFENDQKPKGQR
ncbi:hypothetical protein [uncultured Aeromicrobium sp.]|uniref:hypothetical protein n=1 Tax=uncultured Aeromicrobium sp. TaxID=337820 RepID=UPI0025CC12F5|nr:hypothetical protein [uncultured Aeromicrobium sp.]